MIHSLTAIPFKISCGFLTFSSSCTSFDIKDSKSQFILFSHICTFHFYVPTAYSSDHENCTSKLFFLHYLCSMMYELRYSYLKYVYVSWSDLWRVNDDLCLTLRLFLDDQVMFFDKPQSGDKLCPNIGIRCPRSLPHYVLVITWQYTLALGNISLINPW